MFLSKKITGLIMVILLFLVPISIGINDVGAIQSGEQVISLSANTAYAINLDCDEGFFGVNDAGCQFAEGLLSVYELIVFYFTQIVVVLVGIMLDIFMFLSIDSQFYRSGLIEAGWEILRDFTNIIFIFALLVTAFKMVLGQDESGNKKILVKTILIALVINFSLFITYAVIDGSNILAHTFYNKIEASATYNTSAITGQGSKTDSGTGYSYNDNGLDSGESSLSSLAQSIAPENTKSISLAIAGKINPQKIVNSTNSTALQTFIIISGAGLLNILLIWLFGSVLLLFLGRSIGLMLSAIMAPLAFASLVVPGLQNKSYIGFQKWLPELISLAFMAPVFIFFLYIVVTFIGNDGFIQSIATVGTGEGPLEVILRTYIPFLILGGLLILAKKVTKSMAGELGNMAASVTGKVLGGAVAAGSVAFTGGAALAGGTLRGAGMVAKATGNTKTGKVLQGLGKSAQATNFNFAQSRLGKFASKTTGIDMGERLGELSYARADTSTRIAGNTVRAGLSDVITGKQTESVKKWQDTIQESRDDLTANRLQNAERVGAEKAGGKIKTDTNVTVDPMTGVVTVINTEQTIKPGEAKQQLEQLQAQLAEQTPLTKKAEEDKVRAKKAEIQKVINSKNDTLQETNKEISELTKQIDNYSKTTQELDSKKKNAEFDYSTSESKFNAQITGLQNSINIATKPDTKAKLTSDLANIKAEKTAELTKLDRKVKEIDKEISSRDKKLDLETKLSVNRNERDKTMETIELVKKAQEKVEETNTLKGKVGQIEKIISNKQENRKAALLRRDRMSRFTQQDSNLTVSEKRRQERVQTQTARTVSKDSKSSDKK